MTGRKRIEVLGPGCARCKETFRVVQHVIEAEKVDADVVKDESIERILALGVMATPVVVVDGRIVVSGRIPKADELRQLLR
jgi:small redox-active disulfide protein 2